MGLITLNVSSGVVYYMTVCCNPRYTEDTQGNIHVSTILFSVM